MEQELRNQDLAVDLYQNALKVRKRGREGGRARREGGREGGREGAGRYFFNLFFW